MNALAALAVVALLGAAVWVARRLAPKSPPPPSVLRRRQLEREATASEPITWRR